MDRGVKGKVNLIPKDDVFSFVWSGSATVSAFDAVICSRGSLFLKDAIQKRNHFRNYSKLSLLIGVIKKETKYPQLCKQNNWNRSIARLDYYDVSDHFSRINSLFFFQDITYKTNFLSCYFSPISAEIFANHFSKINWNPEYSNLLFLNMIFTCFQIMNNSGKFREISWTSFYCNIPP